jgi:hypothetical protein
MTEAVTRAEMILEAEHELALRESDYPQLVAFNAMTFESATRRIAVMTVIVEALREGSS